jgi:predicted ATPase
MKTLDAKHYLLGLSLRRDRVPSFTEYPQSTIFLLTGNAITRVRYTDTEHYAVTREFLNKHETMLKDLLEE